MSGAGPRFANADRIRVLAILAIVYYHLPGGRALPPVFQIGLATFFLLTCAFRARHPFTLGNLPALRRRAAHLLVPWVVWSLVYAAVRVRWLVSGEVSFGQVFEPLMLLYGTWEHLWFLPFLLFLEVLVSLGVRAARPLGRAPRVAVWATLAAGGLLLATYGPRGHWLVRGWLYGLAAAPFGLLLAEALASRHRPRILATASAVSLALAVAGSLSGASDVPIRLASGLALVAGSLVVTGRDDRISRLLTGSVLGIYVLHPLVIRQLLGWTAIGSLPLWAPTLLVFATCTALTQLLKKTPLQPSV